jgi:hypothetical protein
MTIQEIFARITFIELLNRISFRHIITTFLPQLVIRLPKEKIGLPRQVKRLVIRGKRRGQTSLERSLYATVIRGRFHPDGLNASEKRIQTKISTLIFRLKPRFRAIYHHALTFPSRPAWPINKGIVRE